MAIGARSALLPPIAVVAMVAYSCHGSDSKLFYYHNNSCRHAVRASVLEMLE